MTDIPELAEPTPNLPKAAADQTDVQPWEEGLLALARVAHPNVSWWHGYRQHDKGWADYCYVCDRVIVELTSNGNPPMAARDFTKYHKWAHRDGILPVTTINEKEAPAS